MDLDALAELGRSVPGFELTHLPSVHAKVYVADDKMAIVTSGNLTEPGLRGNVEYGVALAETGIVRDVSSDLESYASLGARVSVSDVAALSAEMAELKALFRRAERPIRNRARRAFEEKLESTRLRLLRHRAKGTTTNAIFSSSIKFLLAKGPLRTEELHPLIQLLHPDLCDDSIDRVIDGVNFGKKWKHYVRNAQQYLKRHREIRFDGARWHLA
jgi:PLD-like domain